MKSVDRNKHSDGLVLYQPAAVHPAALLLHQKRAAHAGVGAANPRNLAQASAS